MNLPTDFCSGVVIGKFLPPHRCHRFLIETALSPCERVVLIVCGKPVDPIPPELWAGWLREIVPAAEVMQIDDRYDENDFRVWAENTISWLGRPPDVVFTSENYGEASAGHMGCVHDAVDPSRLAVPCSGTSVKLEPFAMWEFIGPPVKAWFAKRVVLVGAESTGTTTLARDLVQALKTEWVPEYGREYSERKQAAGDETWRSEEFLEIAREQTRMEEVAARQANRILICDTNAFATCLWHRRYMGFDLEPLEEFAKGGCSNLYLLTGNEIPFVHDGLRDGEHIRHEMHQWFETALARQHVPWMRICGSAEERLNLAMKSI